MMEILHSDESEVWSLGRPHEETNGWWVGRAWQVYGDRTVAARRPPAPGAREMVLLDVRALLDANAVIEGEE